MVSSGERGALADMGKQRWYPVSVYHEGKMVNLFSVNRCHKSSYPVNEKLSLKLDCLT